jgi:acetyl-CoA carboxylase carboxyltransferase component
MHEGGGGSVGGADNRRDQAQAATTYRSPPSATYETPRFQSVALCLTKVPVVSAAMGTVAGLPASRLAASHFTVMVANGNAQVLTAGPKVVERALGYSTTKQELGGPEMHETSGVVDNFAASEEDAIKQIRAFLSYMPQNIYELPPVTQPGPDRTPEELAQLNTLVPKSRRQTFDMRKALQLTFDRDSFFELGTTKFGQSQITGLARLQGYPVAVMANDCRILAGAMTVDGAQKVTRFIEMAHTFRLPLITFIDEPGFDIGLDAERAGTIRWGTRAVLTAQTAKIPWLVSLDSLFICTIQLTFAFLDQVLCVCSQALRCRRSRSFGPSWISHLLAVFRIRCSTSGIGRRRRFCQADRRGRGSGQDATGARGPILARPKSVSVGGGVFAA